MTRPNIGEDARDSDAILVNGHDTTKTFAVGAGTDSPNHDIGFYSLASIGGVAWVDLNRDGVRQQSEFLLPDAVVHLFIGRRRRLSKHRKQEKMVHTSLPV